MAYNIIGAGTWQSAQRGVYGQETGISIRRWSVRFHPEINEKLPDNVGQTVARAQSTLASREITLEGEVTGAQVGVLMIAFGVAVAYGWHNDLSWPDQQNPGGLIILDEVTQNEERAGWKSINMRLSSDPNLHS